MSLEAWFQLAEALAVIVAVAFAVIQIRQYRRDKNREAAMVLLKSFQTPSFAKALTLVYRLPDGLSKSEVEGRLGDDFHLVYVVYRGEISLAIVDDFFSGPITVSWRRLKGQVTGEREEVDRDTIGEWFEWLADRFADRETSAPPVPAHVAHRNWKPPHERI
jgi:hypothetical protein